MGEVRVLDGGWGGGSSLKQKFKGKYSGGRLTLKRQDVFAFTF